MVPLKYPALWWGIGCLLVAGVIVGSLMPGDLLGEIAIKDKILHAASYFVLMFWFAGLFQRERHLVIAVALLVLGLGLDMAQGSLDTRSFDLRDVAANAGGILAALILSRYLFEGWCCRFEQFVFSR